MPTPKIVNAQREKVLQKIAPAQEADEDVVASTDLAGNGPGYANAASGAKVHPKLAGKPALDGAPDSKKASNPTQLTQAEIDAQASEHDLKLTPGLSLQAQPTNAPTPSPAPNA